MRKRGKANFLRRWKMERASISLKRTKRPRSNKYSSGDREARPTPHKRQQIWVGGYVKRDGTKVKGYIRTNAQFSRRRSRR